MGRSVKVKLIVEIILGDDHSVYELHETYLLPVELSLVSSYCSVCRISLVAAVASLWLRSIAPAGDIHTHTDYAFILIARVHKSEENELIGSAFLIIPSSGIT